MGEKYLATGRPCSTTTLRFQPGGTAVSITMGEEGDNNNNNINNNNNNNLPGGTAVRITMGEEGEEGNESLEECGGVGGADSLLSGSKRSAGKVP